MKVIAVDQRVIEETRYAETRDALDQRWADFLYACGYVMLPLPNHAATAKALLAANNVAGMVMTGGSSHPRRSEVLEVMFAHAEAKQLPIMGVCHGMQAMQQRCGQTLEKVPGHVMAEQTIMLNGKAEIVNSYHDWGVTQSVAELDVWAQADDGVIKAVRNDGKKWLGIMWHPERMAPFSARDIALFQEWFV